MTPEETRRWAERQVLVSLAGNSAARRAVQGSGPEWRRMRPKEELAAFHEAGHAVVAHLLGLCVWELSIVPNEFKVGRTQHAAGYALTAEKGKPRPKCDRAQSLI